MNPYFFGFPGAAGATPMMAGSWFPGSMAPGNAASFHAPGAKNEIKLFVGGLQF